MDRDKVMELHQFGRPRGAVGWLIGHVMALKNAGMNRAAMEHLALRPGERVLEIGFGPGRTIRKVARHLENGFVAGLDHSAVMVRQAWNRNRRLIRAGRVALKCGSVSDMPFEDASFHEAYAVNSFQFWPDPVGDLKQLGRVLKPGGRLVLVIRAAAGTLRFDPAHASGGRVRSERARRAMVAAGFENISLHERRVGRLLAVSVIGHVPEETASPAVMHPGSGQKVSICDTPSEEGHKES